MVPRREANTPPQGTERETQRDREREREREGETDRQTGKGQERLV